MKIQTDQLTALQQTTEQSKGTWDTSDAFAALLSKEVGGDQSAQTSQTAGLTAPPLSSLAGLTMATVQETGTAGTESQFSDQERSAMQDVDSLLAKWENYADKLATGEGDSLKQAYGVLQNIESGVKQLKEELPSDAKNTGLGSLVNELEVMTVTEKIKFNRGDYL